MMYYQIYGQAEQDTTSEGGAVAASELLSTVLPTVAESLTDPTRQVELLQAQIKTTKQLMRTSPALKSVLQIRLRNLKAKLTAAKQRQGRQQESIDATRAYRFLGQAAAVTGIALGVALIVRTVAQTKKISKG
jgi:hypothetical protein